MSHISSLAVTAAAVAAVAVLAPASVSAEPAAPEWQVSTVAGNGWAGYSGDGGPAIEARLGGSTAYGPRIAVTRDGTVYLAEWANHRLRRVTPDGVINTVPGTRTEPSGNPRAVAVAADGTAYLANETEILRVGARGATRVPADTSGLLTDIAVDRAGNVYYADHSFDDNGKRRTSIVRVGRAGGTTTVVEDKADIYSIAVGANGTVYYTTGDFQPDGRTVHAVGANGARRPAATLPAGSTAGAVAIAPDGTPHVVDVTRGRLLRIGPGGTLTQFGPSLAGRIDDLTFRPDGTPYLVIGSTVRRLDRATGEQAAPKPAGARWADDAPGTVHRIAGTGDEPATDQTGLSAPAVGPDGTVYVAQPNRNIVHAIGRDGRVKRFAGTGECHPDVEDPHAYDGKKAEQVDLAYPHAVAAGPDGTVYIATQQAILRVAENGTVSTAAVFDRPAGPAEDLELTHQLSVDKAGTLYYTETTGPNAGTVRTINDDGDVTVIAGQGGNLPGRYSDNKPAVEADLRDPTSVSAGANGTVYVIETSNGTAVHSVRAIRPGGVLVTVAGDADLDLPGDGNFAGDGGPATKAGLNNPHGVAAGPDGSFFVADTYNGRVRRVERTGVITTIAGTGRRAESGDGGPATKAALVDPAGLAAGADGTLYVTSAASTRVRAIAPDGTISTLADLGVPPTERPFADVLALDVGPDDTVYLGTRDGVTSLAPDGTAEHVDGLASMAQLATGPDGSVYQVIQVGAADPAERSAQLWRRYPDGTVVRLAADQPLTGVLNVAVGPDDEVYLSSDTDVFRLQDDSPERLMSTHDKPYGSDGDSTTPDIRAITTGSDGRLYVVAVNRVFAVHNGKTELVAGNGEAESTDEAEAAEDGGPARDASLKSPSDVGVDDDGTVFIATGDGVRRVSDGVIETLDAGDAGQLAVGPSGDLYAASAGQVFAVVQPAKVTVDRTSWTWVWFAAGAVVLLSAGFLLLYRRRSAIMTWWRARR